MPLFHAPLHRVADDAVVVGKCSLDGSELVAILIELAVREFDEPCKIRQPLLRASSEQEEFVWGESGAQASSLTSR